MVRSPNAVPATFPSLRSMSAPARNGASPPRLGDVISGGMALIRQFVRWHPWSFTLAVLGAALFVSAIVASAVVIGRITDLVIIPVLDGGEDIGNRVVLAVAAVMGVALWKAIGITLRRTAASALQFRTRADAREKLIEHQLRLQLAWHDRRSTGDLLSVSEVDTQTGTFVLAPLPYATGASLLLIGTFVMVFATHWILGAIAFVGLSILVVIDIAGAFSLFRDFEEAQYERGVVSGIAHESIDGALTVKALGREAEEVDRFGRAASTLQARLIDIGVPPFFCMIPSASVQSQPQMDRARYRQAEPASVRMRGVGGVVGNGGQGNAVKDLEAEFSPYVAVRSANVRIFAERKATYMRADRRSFPDRWDTIDSMDPHELYGRYRELQNYVGWTDADAARVAAVSDLIEPHLPALVDDFFEEVDRHPNARRVITGGRQQILAIREVLAAWLRDLFCSEYDRDFVEKRWKAGARHVDVGLEQTYTSAALARLRKGIGRAVQTSWQDDSELLFKTLESLNMLLDMDLAIIQDAYEDEYKSRARQSKPARKKRAAQRP